MPSSNDHPQPSGPAAEPFVLDACSTAGSAKANPFDTARRQLDAAAEIIGLDAEVLELLRWPRG